MTKTLQRLRNKLMKQSPILYLVQNFIIDNAGNSKNDIRFKTAIKIYKQYTY